MSANPIIVADVERQLTNEPATSKEIWRRVDCWAPRTVRFILEYLRREGRAVGVDEPTPTGFVRKYRRAA